MFKLFFGALQYFSYIKFFCVLNSRKIEFARRNKTARNEIPLQFIVGHDSPRLPIGDHGDPMAPSLASDSSAMVIHGWSWDNTGEKLV